MILFYGALVWLAAIAFVLALCKAAKNGDRDLRRETVLERPGGAAASSPDRERITV